MPTQDETDEKARAMVVEILKREIRLVSQDDEDGKEVWCVKPGNLEHCAKLIVQTLYS